MKEIITKRYLALALEPIHIGSKSKSAPSATARDVDGFPFIPASSLKGSIRALSSRLFKFEGCDGKGWHCPQPHKCPSCSIFGFANFHAGTASSLVRFSSANVVLIPIKSEFGVFWVSSWYRLTKTGLAPEPSQSIKKHWAFGEQIRKPQIEWLTNILKLNFSPKIEKLSTVEWIGPSDLQETYERTIVLDEYSLSSLFSFFTGRSTSISIDGHTGHARDGSLFEVEHINRMSVLCFEIIYINPILHGIREFINKKASTNIEIPADIEHVEQIIKTGIEKLKFYGIGGKRSRGYGRLNIWELPTNDLSCSESPFIIPPRNKIPLIFISYSSKDISVARRLAPDLQSEQMNVWLDEKKIFVGDSIHQKVEEGISKCDYLILIVSKDSMKSSWVQDEINAIRNREKSQGSTILLPALLSNIDIDGLPALLRDRKVTIFAPKYEDGFRELIESIREHEKRKQTEQHNHANAADAKSRAAD